MDKLTSKERKSLYFFNLHLFSVKSNIWRFFLKKNSLIFAIYIVESGEL